MWHSKTKPKWKQEDTAEFPTTINIRCSVIYHMSIKVIFLVYLLPILGQRFDGCRYLDKDVHSFSSCERHHRPGLMVSTLCQSDRKSAGGICQRVAMAMDGFGGRTNNTNLQSCPYAEKFLQIGLVLNLELFVWGGGGGGGEEKHKIYGGIGLCVISKQSILQNK